MFIERITTQIRNKNGKISQRSKVMYKFKCDECAIIYEKRPGNVSVSRSGLHFCSNKCKFKSMKSGKMKTVFEETSLKNFGERIPMRSEIVKTKLRKKLQKNYGNSITTPMNVPGAKEKWQRTHLERYGARFTFQIDVFKQKRNVTWSKNNKKWKNVSSKAELKFMSILIEHFGIDDVISQKWVNGRPVDFYIKSIDTYIQFDGVYWHGLNRPIEFIKNSTTARDKKIYETWISDKAQDEWFSSNSLRLIRITDVEFAMLQEKILQKIIE